MKTWATPEVEKLDITCTEYGKAYASHVDEVRVDQNGKYWYSYSGDGEQNPAGTVTKN